MLHTHINAQKLCVFIFFITMLFLVGICVRVDIPVILNSKINVNWFTHREVLTKEKGAI